MSILCFFLNKLMKKSVNLLSKSSPPRWVSPAVERTSKTWSSMLKSDTSKVPPPRSNISIFFSFFWSMPYAIEAAVGSLIILSTLSPAIVPASFVAYLWASLKYAGTVTTACLTSFPMYYSAVSFIFFKIIADIYSGEYRLFPFLVWISTYGFPSTDTTLYGSFLISFWTSLSSKFLPISLLMTYNVFIGFWAP